MNKSEIIERLKNIAEYAVHTVGEEPFVMSIDDGIAVHEAIELLEKQEPLTDREQRIFLAAMSREKEVCKEVDYQFSDAREPYEDTLVRVCGEIKRKVKAALWTN
jgi:hypothetical protein